MVEEECGRRLVTLLYVVGEMKSEGWVMAEDQDEREQ